jgi:hypothetical protein
VGVVLHADIGTDGAPTGWTELHRSPEGDPHIVFTAIVSPGSGKGGREVEATPSFQTGFPLIRSLRASAQRSTPVLFSFVLSLLIVAGPFAIVDQNLSASRIRR